MNDYFLADDLSGALEVAAAFHQAGRRAVVTWSPQAWRASAPDEVVGFTTETRNVAPELAAAAVSEALAQGQARGGRLLFKKIDSTLRGPVAAELAALTAALPATTVLFTPANPHAGRTVRDGVLLVNGVPVADSDFGRDPVNPVTDSSIRRVVPLAARARVIALDAGSDEDLSRALSAREQAGDSWVAVGSGALARLLAARFAAGTEQEVRPVVPPSPTLFVCGSAHPVNRTQAAKLARERGAAVVAVSPGEPDAAMREVSATLKAGGVAALQLAERQGTAADSRLALQSIADAAAAAIQAAGVRRIMATGGETARAICDRLGIEALRVLGDIEPGLVLAGARNADGEWLMAIKPGGFGSEACWVRAFDALNRSA
jgi:uncharacterized protein YgbK (DUF1537 family)